MKQNISYIFQNKISNFDLTQCYLSNGVARLPFAEVDPNQAHDAGDDNDSIRSDIITSLAVVVEVGRIIHDELV